MEKTFSVILCLLTLATNIKAQDSDQVGWVSKFGLAAGISPVWIIPNFDVANKIAPAMKLDKFNDAGMFGYGGSGYAYIMIVDNLRLGGIGFGGSQSRTAFVDGFDKEVVYKINTGGLTVEYTLPFVKKIAVSIGAILGGGSIEIDLYQNKGSFDWTDILNEVSDPVKQTQNVNRSLHNSFFMVSPTLNIDIPVNRFMAFRIGGGYTFALSNTWKADNGKPINNASADLNSDSFFIQTGIFFGFFAF